MVAWFPKPRREAGWAGDAVPTVTPSHAKGEELPVIGTVPDGLRWAPE